jgi:(R,R)-butanediol dehydrogenase/meso-butanediol dehydrogenase/diacetyl reductase
MQALRWHARQDVRLEEVELALPLGPGLVEVAVSSCGICGSDLAEYATGPHAVRDRPYALSGQQAPVTLGHEFSGRVVAVGAGVDGVGIGDRVAADACWRCGSCSACRAGTYNLCAKGGSIGLVSDGALAERIRFPAYCVVPLPDRVSDEAGALLEPLAVALHALDRGGATAGETVVVLGFGPIGAATAIVARAMGLSVLVSEPAAGRRARAEALGFATSAPEGEPRDVTRAIRSLTDGGARLVVDCTGATGVLSMAPEMTRRGGTIVLVGLPKDPPTIDAARLVLFERSIVASLGYVHDLPRVAAMIAAGALEPDALITKRVELAQAPDEFERLTTAPGDDLKVLVTPVAA